MFLRIKQQYGNGRLDFSRRMRVCTVSMPADVVTANSDMPSAGTMVQNVRYALQYFVSYKIFRMHLNFSRQEDPVWLHLYVFHPFERTIK